MMNIRAILFVILSSTVMSQDPVVVPHLGVEINKEGVVAHFSGVSTILVTFSLGSPETWVKENILAGNRCAAKAAETQHDLSSILKQSILSHTSHIPDSSLESPRRSKRFLSGIIGIGAGILGEWIYNRFSSNSVESTVQHVKAHMAVLNQQIASLTKESSISRAHELIVWHNIMSLKNNIKDLIKVVNCDSSDLDILKHYVPIISLIPNQWHRALNSLLAHTLTPDLISKEQIISLLVTSPEMADSIYHTHPMMFYESGHTDLISFDRDNMIVYYSLQIPIVKSVDIYPLLRIYNYGFFHNHTGIRAKLPHYAAYNIRDSKGLHPIDDLLCKKQGSTWFCDTRSVTWGDRYECLDKIMSNQSLLCPVESMRVNGGKTHHMITPSGVFIYSESETVTLVNITKFGKTISHHGPYNHSTYWPFSSFHELIVGEYSIISHTNKSRREFHTVLSINWTMINTVIREVQDSYKWVNLPNVTTAQPTVLLDDFMTPNLTTMWGSDASIVSLVLLIFALGAVLTVRRIRAIERRLSNIQLLNSNRNV